MSKPKFPEKEAKLRAKIEEITGRVPKSPTDYDILADKILTRTKKRVSSTTLKRFWKYIEKESNISTRWSVLDVLADFVGYTSWQAFIDTEDPDAENNDFFVTETIKATSLKRGEKLRLVWNPEHSIVVRHIKNDLFTVLESVNCKLDAGDTFRCPTIMDMMPLILTEVVHNGMEPCNFICGRIGGVKVRR